MKIGKYFVNDCGAGQAFAPARKEWIATAIGAGVGLASSFIGGLKASSAMDEAEQRQRAMEGRSNALYERRYNQSYADTGAGQDLLRRAREFAWENGRRVSGQSAVTGATDAAAAQAKDAGNKMVSDTMAHLAASDTARKANLDAQHMADERQFAQMDMNRSAQRAQNITQAAQAASNAIMQGSSAFESDVDLTGGSNKGITKASAYGVGQVDGSMETMRRAAEADRLRLFGGGGV